MSLNKLSCPFPANINPLSSGGFMFTIQKAPAVKFWCNQANLPGLTLGTVAQATPFIQIPQPGDTLVYDTLNIQFMIDADMINYIELWNWMNGLGFPESNENFTAYMDADTRGMRGELAKSVSDASLTILNNSNVPVKTIQLIDLFPVNLNSLQLQANNSDVVYMIGEATFQFSHWKFL